MEYKVNNLFYASGSKMRGTLRTNITLTEPVDSQILENALNEHIRNDKIIRDMDLAGKQSHMQKAILDGIGTNTFEVSYTGRVPWGGMEKYITNIAPYLDMTLSGGITIEIFSVGDAFSVNIMQRSADAKYIDRFADLLKKLEVSYTAEAPEHFTLCDIQLPD